MNYYLKFILSTIIIFFIILILKRNFFPSQIFFYESIFLLIMFSIILILIEKIIFKKNLFRFHFISSIIIFFLVSYSIIITGPALSKRSISLFLLETVEIHSEQNGLSKKDLNKNIVEVFFLRQNELQRRINEQLYSNNIYIKDGNYIISDRGKLINNINRLLIKIFNL